MSDWSTSEGAWETRTIDGYDLYRRPVDGRWEVKMRVGSITLTTRAKEAMDGVRRLLDYHGEGGIRTPGS